MLTDLQNILMFCLFYSGFVMYSLWITVARTPGQVEARARKLSQ